MRPRIAPWLVACALSLRVAFVHAQTPEEVAKARTLFVEALRDEQVRSYTVALEKFQRVRLVRDNAAVRYRIASCLENLGRLRAARDLYAVVVGEGAKPTPEDAEIQASARGKVAELDGRIPTLAVRPADGGAATLTIDGRSALVGEAVPVDPGDHVVTLARAGVAPAETRATVREGAHVALSIPLGTPRDDAGPRPPRRDGSSQRMVGAIVGGTGVALGVAAFVLVLVREGTISNISEACPGGACPRGRQTEVEGWRSRASTLGPIAAVLGGAGALAAGTGVVLFITAPASAKAPAEAFLGVEGRFP